MPELSLGNFSTASIIADIVFGAIGIAAFIYGKKNKSWHPMLIGIVLMAYPYFISVTWLVYFLGITLTAALYFWKE